MDVNFELYKVFYYVAKTLSFSEASNELYISQSAVSQSIKLLEEKLHCRLFFRHTKQVKLTQEGEILFKHVEQAFNFIKTGERSITEIHSLQHGEVRIGATDTICKHYLLPYFQKFNELYPQIKIHVTSRTSPGCIELLRKGSVDLIVINTPDKGVPKNMAVNKVKTLQDVFIAGSRFKHLKNQQLELKELAQYPLLMLEKNTTTREFFDTLIKKNGVQITPEIELDSVDLLIELAKIGLGIAFVIRDYVEKELANEEFFVVRIKEEIPPRGLGILTQNNIPLPLAAKKFIELLETKKNTNSQ